MNITIFSQHLFGNDPDGFNSTAWLSALHTEYENIVSDLFPNAVIFVQTDCRYACGYSRPPIIYYHHCENMDASLRGALELRIEQAADSLCAQRGHEFFR
jgi:hypothetical protein